MTLEQAFNKLKYTSPRDVIREVFTHFEGRKNDRCRICGKPFVRKGSAVTCSPKCSLENQRQNKRRSWHRTKQNDDKYARHIRQRMRRIRNEVCYNSKSI